MQAWFQVFVLKPVVRLPPNGGPTVPGIPVVGWPSHGASVDQVADLWQRVRKTNVEVAAEPALAISTRAHPGTGRIAQLLGPQRPVHEGPEGWIIQQIHG